MPSLGENIKAGDVLHVLIKAGDVVAVDQPGAGTDPQAVPSSIAGTVGEDGDRIDVGQVILHGDGRARRGDAGEGGALVVMAGSPSRPCLVPGGGRVWVSAVARRACRGRRHAACAGQGR